MGDRGAPATDRLSSPAVTAIRWAALAVAASGAAFFLIGRRLGWLDYRPGGAPFDSFVSPVAAAVLVVAALLALRRELAGALVAVFAAGALVAFAVEQLVASHAALVVLLLAIPGVLWLVLAVTRLPVGRALVAGIAVGVMALGGVAAGATIYDHFWGPTHPESSTPSLPDSPLEWVWSGAVTTTSAEVRARPSDDFRDVRLLVGDDPSLSPATTIAPRDESGRVVGFVIDDLSPDTEYFYAVEVDGEVDRVRTGRFTTFPDGASSFTVAVGACARNGSNGAVFDAIRRVDPLVYLSVGDLHYGDVAQIDVERYREVMDLTLSAPAQSALYRSTPIAYVWDDHDYGANDADGRSPSRAAAMAAYREHVPSYQLAGQTSAVYQSFSVGRVRFVMTDARSARDLDETADGAPSMLGADQKAWLKRELVDAARSHELVVWVNPVPWIAEERSGADHWGGYADERRELADHIADNDIGNLLMVSGDAHMVAIDDGTNTDYSTNGHPGFPLVHAAPLDRPGGVKGGPYSEGVSTEGGQFATVDVVDDGDVITVQLTGRSWDGEVLMTHEFSTDDMTGND